jgi:hypothetical protein
MRTIIGGIYNLSSLHKIGWRSAEICLPFFPTCLFLASLRRFLVSFLRWMGKPTRQFLVGCRPIHLAFFEAAFERTKAEPRPTCRSKRPQQPSAETADPQTPLSPVQILPPNFYAEVIIFWSADQIFSFLPIFFSKKWPGLFL